MPVAIGRCPASKEIRHSASQQRHIMADDDALSHTNSPFVGELILLVGEDNRNIPSTYWELAWAACRPKG